MQRKRGADLERTRLPPGAGGRWGQAVGWRGAWESGVAPGRRGGRCWVASSLADENPPLVPVGGGTEGGEAS